MDIYSLAPVKKKADEKNTSERKSPRFTVRVTEALRNILANIQETEEEDQEDKETGKNLTIQSKDLTETVQEENNSGWIEVTKKKRRPKKQSKEKIKESPMAEISQQMQELKDFLAKTIKELIKETEQKIQGEIESLNKKLEDQLTKIEDKIDINCKEIKKIQQNRPTLKVN